MENSHHRGQHFCSKDFFRGFSETYHNLIAMTKDYDDMVLPKLSVCIKDNASSGIEYDAIIDISIDQLCNAKEVTFSRFKVLNDCYFIVRSSEKCMKTEFFIQLSVLTISHL